MKLNKITDGAFFPYKWGDPVSAFVDPKERDKWLKRTSSGSFANSQNKPHRSKKSKNRSKKKASK
jgi:hypothetical protein